VADGLGQRLWLGLNHPHRSTRWQPGAAYGATKLA
jgi:hypothetical protein